MGSMYGISTTRKSKRGFGNSEEEPPAHHVPLFGQSGFPIMSAKILDWEVAYPNAGQRVNHFQVWFDRQYPVIAEEAYQLLRVVRAMGYDTPEKQKALYREILRIYDLQYDIYVR